MYGYERGKRIRQRLEGGYDYGQMHCMKHLKNKLQKVLLNSMLHIRSIKMVENIELLINSLLLGKISSESIQLK